jgi:glycosyltransferase involved in cell wall biosynthesis
MKIWVYAIFYNEALLLPFFLRYYGAIADRIVLYDHGSTDNGPDIARACKRVDLRHYEPEAWDEYDVAALASSAYREARGIADWVIWVDIDEFLYHPELRHCLYDYAERGVTLPRVQGYTMIADALPAPGQELTRTCRLGIPDPLYSKPCIFHPGIDIHYSPGKHHANASGPVIISGEHPLKLLHYRYFGPEWLRERAESHYPRLSERTKQDGMSWHIYPENTGMYSQAWFDEMRERRVEVI